MLWLACSIRVRFHALATSKDAYNRLLVFCTVNGINVNQWMVSKGWAFAFIKYDKCYQKQQIRAESRPSLSLPE